MSEVPLYEPVPPSFLPGVHLQIRLTIQISKLPMGGGDNVLRSFLIGESGRTRGILFGSQPTLPLQISNRERLELLQSSLPLQRYLAHEKTPPP